MRSSRYTCIESALMIVPLRRWAMASASADLPLAVGPATIRAGGGGMGTGTDGNTTGAKDQECLSGRLGRRRCVICRVSLSNQREAGLTWRITQEADMVELAETKSMSMRV